MGRKSYHIKIPKQGVCIHTEESFSFQQIKASFTFQQIKASFSFQQNEANPQQMFVGCFAPKEKHNSG